MTKKDQLKQAQASVQAIDATVKLLEHGLYVGHNWEAVGTALLFQKELLKTQQEHLKKLEDEIIEKGESKNESDSPSASAGNSQN